HFTPELVRRRHAVFPRRYGDDRSARSSEQTVHADRIGTTGREIDDPDDEALQRLRRSQGAGAIARSHVITARREERLQKQPQRLVVRDEHDARVWPVVRVVLHVAESESAGVPLRAVGHRNSLRATTTMTAE